MGLKQKKPQARGEPLRTRLYPPLRSGAAIEKERQLRSHHSNSEIILVDAATPPRFLSSVTSAPFRLQLGVLLKGPSG
jgi:hypothetical protein